jgi:hypothetical protein
MANPEAAILMPDMCHVKLHPRAGTDVNAAILLT